MKKVRVTKSHFFITAGAAIALQFTLMASTLADTKSQYTDAVAADINYTIQLLDGFKGAKVKTKPVRESTAKTASKPAKKSAKKKETVAAVEKNVDLAAFLSGLNKTREKNGLPRFAYDCATKECKIKIVSSTGVERLCAMSSPEMATCGYEVANIVKSTGNFNFSAAPDTIAQANNVGIEAGLANDAAATKAAAKVGKYSAPAVTAKKNSKAASRGLASRGIGT